MARKKPKRKPAEPATHPRKTTPPGKLEDELEAMRHELSRATAKVRRLEATVRKRKPMKRGTYTKFPLRVSRREPDPGIFQVSEILPLEEIKTSYVEWVIRKLKGDKPEAADRLDISLRTIYNMFDNREAAPENA